MQNKWPLRIAKGQGGQKGPPWQASLCTPPITWGALSLSLRPHRVCWLMYGSCFEQGAKPGRSGRREQSQPAKQILQRTTATCLYRS